MRTTGYGSTDVGRKRVRNEDRLLVDTKLGLYAVADGMGGHEAGDLAATIAVETVARVVKRYLAAADIGFDGIVGPDVLAFIVREAVRQANREVHFAARTAKGAHGMGCTLTVLLVQGEIAALAHVGDSRLYLLRDSRVRQLSEDHTLVADLVKVGAISKDQAKDHHCSHVITRAVGTSSSVDVDVTTFDAEENDRFLICSDGLSNSIDDEGWLSEVLGEDDLSRAAEQLICHANEAGGDDNITAVLVSIESDLTEQWYESPSMVFEESSSGMTPF